TGLGNPDWCRTYSAVTSIATVVLAGLKGGATCVDKTVMDKMAYSTNRENQNYGTPRNSCAPDRVPEGSSGSAVAVGATLVDFSLVLFTIETDTRGSVRVPASYCGIVGFRPSHGVVSTVALIPMAQSFGTVVVVSFARDPIILNRVGHILLQMPDINPARPTQLIIEEDYFQLSSIPNDEILVKSVEKLVCSGLLIHNYEGHIVNHKVLGDYFKDTVPSLKHFMSNGNENKDRNIPSLAALSSVMLSMQRYIFKKNHGEGVTTVKPSLGPEISERV
ncbi:LOW QUALITY PROTEIN: Amidase domain-containing protein, partial [Cephalotus follicularis]